VGEWRGLRTVAQQQTGAIAGSRIVQVHGIGNTKLKRRVAVTASMAWPSFHREMEERSTNRWQHRLQREHPTGTERRKSLTESADGRVATAMAGKGLWVAVLVAKRKSSASPPTFLPSGMVADRSSPSRVRYAAQNAPLTAPGRSANPPLGRKVDSKEGQIKTCLTQTGLLMEGHSTSLRRLFAHCP
jgi:hypothetical protein